MVGWQAYQVESELARYAERKWSLLALL
jgi:hypothetical protein